METLLLGALVSGLVQWLKNKLGTSTAGTLSMVAILSIAAGAIYATLVGLGFWPEAYKILVTSGAIYAFIIQRFESTQSTG